MDIAKSLDIVDVDVRPADGYEGMLLFDPLRSRGGILANTSKGMKRARFTVAHELGHFLMEWHVETCGGGFRCRSEDMRETRMASRHQRQEVEANRFAAEVLSPAYLVAPWIDRDVDIGKAHGTARALEISFEAAMRRYVERHDEPLAALWSVAGRIQYFAANTRFPSLARHPGDEISPATAAARVIAAGQRGLTGMKECDAAAWLRDPEIELYEQTRVDEAGRGVTLLWATTLEADLEDEDAVHRPLTTPRFGPRR